MIFFGVQFIKLYSETKVVAAKLKKEDKTSKQQTRKKQVSMQKFCKTDAHKHANKSDLFQKKLQRKRE